MPVVIIPNFKTIPTVNAQGLTVGIINGTIYPRNYFPQPLNPPVLPEDMSAPIEIELLAPATLPNIEGGSVELISPINDEIFGDFLESKSFVELPTETITIDMVEPVGTGGGGGGGGTIPSTLDLLQGDGSGNAADSLIKTSQAVAAENLAAFDIVTIDGFKANSSNGAHYGKVIGITRSAVTTGFVADVIYYGEIVNGSWSWSAGQKLFLNGTSLSTTPPASGFVQMIAVAKNPTTITMRVEIPVLL